MPVKPEGGRDLSARVVGTIAGPRRIRNTVAGTDTGNTSRKLARPPRRVSQHLDRIHVRRHANAAGRGVAFDPLECEARHLPQPNCVCALEQQVPAEMAAQACERLGRGEIGRASCRERV